MRPQLGRQKLFDAAMKLFETQGYFATTVAQITAEAGVSKGLVYNYFASKEELLVGLLDDATEKMELVAAPLTDAHGLEASLTSFLNGYFTFLHKHRRFLKLQLQLMLMPELREIVAEPQRRRAQALSKTIEGWFRRAGVAQPKRKARLLLALLDGVALHYLCVYDHYPLASMKPQVLQAARDLYEQPAPEPIQ